MLNLIVTIDRWAGRRRQPPYMFVVRVLVFSMQAAGR
jgi:hypothetical protein